jgi:hypothetical protein
MGEDHPYIACFCNIMCNSFISEEPIDFSNISWLHYEFNAANMTTAMSAVCQVQAAIVGIVLTVYL